MPQTPTDPAAGSLGTRFAQRAGHAVFRGRDALAPILLVALMVLTRRQDFFVPIAFDVWLDALGFAAIGVGLALRLWVVAHSGIRRSGVRKRVVAPTLFEDGPYACCRNPLYLGNAIILVGLAAIYDSRWMAFGALPLALLAIRSIVATEERVLTQSFGARYLRYCARVPRFVPRRPAMVGAPPPNWRRALRKEHGTIFAATSTAIVLLSAESFTRFGAFGHRRGPVLLIAWVLLAATWAGVRKMKRAGYLGDVGAIFPETPIQDLVA